MKNEYKDTVLQVQQEKYESWIEKARKAARRIAKRKGKVSADDVRRVCPPPPYADPRVMGAIFYPRDDWEHVEYRRSARKEAHCRPVSVWRLAPHAA